MCGVIRLSTTTTKSAVQKNMYFLYLHIFIFYVVMLGWQKTQTSGFLSPRPPGAMSASCRWSISTCWAVVPNATDQGAETTEAYFLTALEAGRVRSRFGPLRSLPPWLADSPGAPLVFPLCPSLLFLRGHQSDWIRAHPNGSF